MNKLMAFWYYDKYPFCLCGEVKKVHPDGYVQTKEYYHMSFKPIAIIDYKEGVKIKEKLDNLKKDYEEKSQQLKLNYVRLSEDVAPFLKRSG